MTQGTGQNLLVQGRIIWGMGNSLFEGKAKTDYNSGQPIFDAQGNAVVEYGFGLAIPKVDPQTGQNTQMYTEIWQALHNEAYTLYPNGQLPPRFAMKFKDGDTDVDQNGKPYSERSGYAGHIVITCTTQIPIKFFKFDGANNILVNDGIKVGDYVNVQLNIKAHPGKNNGNPGLYLNPSAVQLVAEGEAIVNSPSGDSIFGNTAPNYAGEVIAPTAPTMPMMGQQPAQAPAAPNMPPMGGQQPAGMPTNGGAQMNPMGGQPAQAPAANPHYGVLPEQHQPAQAPAAAPNMPPMGGQQPMGNVPPANPAAPTQPMGNYGQNTTNATSANPAYPSNGMPAMPQ